MQTLQAAPVRARASDKSPEYSAQIVGDVLRVSYIEDLKK